MESDRVDGEDVEVVDMNDTGDWLTARETGDSDREAELAVSMATGDGLRFSAVW